MKRKKSPEELDEEEVNQLQGECSHDRAEPMEWHWSGRVRVMYCRECGLREYREDEE